MASAENSLTLLYPTTLEIQFHKCLVMDDPLLPKLRLLGRLPSVSVNITDARLLQMLSIVQSIPLPEEKKSAELQRTSLSKSVSQLSLRELTTLSGTITDKKKQESNTSAPMKQTIDLEMKFEMKEFTLSVSRQSDETASEFVRFTTLALKYKMFFFPLNLLFIIIYSFIFYIMFYSEVYKDVYFHSYF